MDGYFFADSPKFSELLFLFQTSLAIESAASIVKRSVKENE